MQQMIFIADLTACSTSNKICTKNHICSFS